MVLLEQEGRSGTARAGQHADGAVIPPVTPMAIGRELKRNAQSADRLAVDVSESSGLSSPAKLMKGALVTFIDQAALSAVTFAVGLAFLYRGTPAQYGLFTLLASAVYLLGSAQNALVNTPMIVLAPRMKPGEVERFEQALFAGLMPGALIASAIAAGILVVVEPGIGRWWQAVPIISIVLLPQLLRDFFRSQEYAHLSPDIALRRDGVFAVVAILSVVILSYLGSIRALPAFVVLGIAAACVSFGPAGHSLGQGLNWSVTAGAYRSSWGCSCWALLGALTSWAQSYAYVYIPYALSGAQEVGYLAAARLMIMPVSLLSQSWSNLYRPLASRHLAQRQERAARKLFRLSSAILGTILVLYTSLVLFALNVLPARVLPQRYVGVDRYLLLWAGVVLLQIVRSNLSSLLQAQLAFRSLAIYGAVVAAVSVGVTVVLVHLLGSIGSLVGLSLGELLLTLGLALQLRQRRDRSEVIVVPEPIPGSML